MTVHRLKVWPQFFEDLVSRSKPFEIRRDDRTPRFEDGDIACLEEWSDSVIGGYTGRYLPARILKVWRGSPMPDGFCVFTFENGNSSGLVQAACSMARESLVVSK